MGHAGVRPVVHAAQDPVDFGAQAAAFAALIEHWGLDRPHVVTHDFGGAMALRATLAERAVYASLLLVDVVAIPPSGSPFFRFVQEHPGTLENLPPYIHEAIGHRGLTAEDLDELVAPWCSDAGRGAFYRQIAQYDEQFLVENERRLGELDLPVRVVWGAQDSWIPIQTGRRLADLIPGAGFVEIPAAGHLVQYDAPVALANLIRGLLTRRQRARVPRARRRWAPVRGAPPR